jgi:hypothetical protein
VAICQIFRSTLFWSTLQLKEGQLASLSGDASLGPGGFVELPANTYHYAFTKIPTVIQISGEGPFGIAYANPTDDPSKK